MGTLYPVAGCKYYIGPAIELPDDDITEATFTGIAWTQVKSWLEAGNLGDAAALITTPVIDRSRDIKQKGTRNAPSRQDNFGVVPSDPGQMAMIAAEQTDYNYPIRCVLNDEPVVRTFAVTISNASPAVVTKVDHGLPVNTAVKFATMGSLPTGLTAGTTYYVKTADDDTFTLSATPGGTAINTSGAGSGTHTATTVPSPSERLFIGLVTAATEAFGGPNNVRQLQCTVEVNTNTVRLPALG
ncbi:hypothetical protein [Devosia sp. Root105]|uniref:hypothetical protein n=1 Tax=Devosia sp. Root105 TaxID=1736423 RepID=UPI00070025C1|nr:hypothetical protein [Devosia sp. Root105]KQU96436.1 hypothetical protein ASC68_13740 [Devosia sp. Root105]